MSDPQKAVQQAALRRKRAAMVDSTADTDALAKLLLLDPSHRIFKTISYIFIVALILFIGVIVVMGIYFTSTIEKMHTQYIRDTEQVIVTKFEIEASNSWERLPLNERKEKVRMQYYQIVRYYTNRISDDNKMDDLAIQDSFNQLWDTTSRTPSVNFFLPVAYMKVASNFNPIYDVDYKHGIAGFLNKTGERISNLKLIREDPSFQLEYNGIGTLNTPTEAIKLLVARSDDLMITFNNRADWVFFSMFTNEYDVIERYWDDGDGSIPDEFYKSGELAEALKYFNAFKNWQIPMDLDSEIE